jgi:membrane fusion protein
MSLFRQEAIEFQQHGRYGEVVLVQPTSTKVLTWFGLASVLVTGAFLALAEYSHKQSVSGFLVPVSGTAKVFAWHDGVIQDVLVRQGDLVHKDQPLFTVSTEQIAADRSSVQQQVLAILRQQKALLSQQIDAEQARISSEKERLTHLSQSYQTEQDSVLAQLTSQ